MNQRLVLNNRAFFRKALNIFESAATKSADRKVRGAMVGAASAIEKFSATIPVDFLSFELVRKSDPTDAASAAKWISDVLAELGLSKSPKAMELIASLQLAVDRHRDAAKSPAPAAKSSPIKPWKEGEGLKGRDFYDLVDKAKMTPVKKSAASVSLSGRIVSSK